VDFYSRLRCFIGREIMMRDMTLSFEGKERDDERGYVYIALLIFIAAMSVGLAATGEVWRTAIQRDKEEELLYVGNQFRNAITMYYLHAPAQAGRYPMRLEDLLKDPRYPEPKRYLRKIYLDPISNSPNWELIKGANGEIMGVHCASEDEPIKKANFTLVDQEFEGKKKYSEWEFVIPARYIKPSLMKPAVNVPSGKNIPGSRVRGLTP
jgi:type II secretory pathway pseudopilin PulG